MTKMPFEVSTCENGLQLAARRPSKNARINIIRLFGDISHLLATGVLLWKIWKTGSCAGISGKSHFVKVFAPVYTTRYVDLFFFFVSLYNSSLLSRLILRQIQEMRFMGGFGFLSQATYDFNHDTVRMEFLLIPCVLLSLLITLGFSPVEVLWTFSIYLEAVAILPTVAATIYGEQNRGSRNSPRTISSPWEPNTYRALYFCL